MTVEEAMEILDVMKEPYCEEENEALNMAITALEEIQQYRAIGTVSEFRELKEKATAKKVVDIHKSVCVEDIEFNGEHTLYGYCPSCNTFLCDLWNEKSCGECNQVVDWSEGKE